jgi:hypothetical protein
MECDSCPDQYRLPACLPHWLYVSLFFVPRRCPVSVVCPLLRCVKHAMPRRCPVSQLLQVQRHECRGPVREFRWSHANRQDITVFVETTQSRSIQMVFGSQFDHQRSGYHGEFDEINRTTIFLRGVRFSGIHATVTLNMTFLKMATSETQQWHCVGQPIIITELDDDHIPLPHSSLPASSTTLTTLQQRYFPTTLLALGDLVNSSSSVPSSSASSSSSSSAVATDSTSSSSSHPSSGPYTSLTWEKYLESLRV